MPVTIIATVSSASANSYVTLAEADAYFATRLYATDFTSLSDDDRSRALIMATERIDQELYYGVKTDGNQALKWPRTGVPIPGESGSFYSAGLVNYYLATAIPSVVKLAQYEYALLISGTDILAQSDLGNYKRVKVGPIEVEMNQPVASGIISAEVARLLNGIRLGSSGAAIVRS